MPLNTNTYKLGYFQAGSYYSALSDYRRFVTIDYNLKSYIGILGVGVINGWTIEETTGLNIQVLPGVGIINGFYMESPYTVKQRSDMVAGDREILLLVDTLPKLMLLGLLLEEELDEVYLNIPSHSSVPLP